MGTEEGGAETGDEELLERAVQVCLHPLQAVALARVDHLSAQ